MDEDLSRNLNPRKVLAILNEMGVSNINVHQLKEFMTDLKKLIRNDMEKKVYSNSTVSSRLKSVNHSTEQTNIKPIKHCRHDIPERKENLEDKKKQPPIKFRKMQSSDNFIKVANKELKKKSDPVSLYSYYADLWEKYKPSLPGETSRAEIRWAVRRKMLSERDSGPKEIIPLTKEELARRRDGWID